MSTSQINDGTDGPPFRSMAEALGIGMPYQVRVPPGGQQRQFTFVGRNCREMTGVEAEAALRDAGLLYERILEEHRGPLAAAEERALAQGRPFAMEVRMLDGEGVVHWRRIVSTPRPQPDGSTLWEGLLSDVTDARLAAAELEEQRRRLEAAVEATGLGLWEWDVREGTLTWSDRNRELLGAAPGERLTIERYVELVHPEDRESVQRVYEAASGKPHGGDFVVEHRTAIQPDGKPRWLQTRGRVVKDAGGVKLVVGTCLDVTGRRASEERRSLLMGELAHRLKNGILVMMAIVAQTARSVTSVKEFEETLMARLRAMAASQDLVTASGGQPVALADVVTTTLTPFDPGRFEVDETLADVTIAGEVAVALGLLLHELSTNAVKYGALSRPSGRVAIRRGEGKAGQAVLRWAERGGPEVAPAKRKGFGSKLLEVSLRPQGGKVEPVFDPAGFQADIRFPAAPSAQ